jgi:hypothetical protein
MKTNNHTTLFAIALAIFMLFLAGPAFSQNEPADTMQIVREKVQADKKLFIAEYMKLTESEANVFWPVYDAYQKELSKLGDRFLVMVIEYAQNHSAMSNKAAKKLLDDHMAFEKDSLKIMKSYMPKFNDALPWKRVTQYYQLENKIKSVTNYGIAARIPLIP